jgi:hypothetical protein
MRDKWPNNPVGPAGTSRFCQRAFAALRRLVPAAHRRHWTAMRSISLVLLVFIGSACDAKKTALPSEAQLNRLKSGYDASLENAKTTIPYAVDFLHWYPQAVAYWSYYTGEAGPPVLNLEALLYRRYQLSMQVPVTFSGDRRSVQSFGEPDFLLQEISEVKPNVRVGSNGSATNLLVGKQGDQSLRFGAAEWKRVVAHGGDLSVLGIPIITNSPAPGFELLQADWNLRTKGAP